MKKNYNVALALVLTMFQVACGKEENSSSSEAIDAKSNETKSESVGAEPSESAKDTEPDKSSETPRKSGPIEFRGFVGGAFPINVDGVHYEDSEDFFTSEAGKLPEKLTAAGYDTGWEGRFEAALGFNDLRTSMVVYISPEGKKGYQGEGTVGDAGGFNITLPAEANDSVYKVRAVKRIHIVLTKELESRKICYNFSAVEKSVKLSDLEKPIILENFNTKITSYQCVTQTSGGAAIPQIQTEVADDGRIVQKIKKGDLKSKVLEKWGPAASVELPLLTSPSPVASFASGSSANNGALTKWYYQAPFRSTPKTASTVTPAGNSGYYSSISTSSSNADSASCILTFREALLESFSRECAVKFIQIDSF